MLGSDLLEPRSGEGVHVRSNIRFPSLTGCSHPFGVHDLGGTHNTWLCLFLLGPSSSEIATSKTSHVVLHVGLGKPRLSGV